ncbi:MAG: hypothetical protein ACK505_12410 [Flavobacteriales bacterium]|jgi:hypothetical protein
MQKYEVTRGDKWNGPLIKFRREGFDFAGCEIKAQLRKSVKDNTAAYDFTITPDASVVGEISFRLEIPGNNTKTLEISKYLGDVKIFRTDPQFGPFTPLKFELNVVADVTKLP